MNVRFWFHGLAGSPSSSSWDMDAVPSVGDEVAFRYNYFKVETVQWFLDDPNHGDVRVEVNVQFLKQEYK